MKIKFLGNGGAINDGLPYNSFIINDDFLVESPPDIMNSLFREHVDILKISTVYISHFHADHYFGIPIFFLRLFVDGSDTPVKVVGPCGIEERVCSLCITAFGKDHPMQEWIRQYVTYENIEAGRNTFINDCYLLDPVTMFHSPETFGFRLGSGGKTVTYLADSYWDDSLVKYIDDADAVIVDLNGEKEDKVKIHISEYDLITHALPVIKTGIRFLGTHLRENRVSDNERIQYVKPGDEIDI